MSVITEYIAQQEPEVQKACSQLHRLIKEEVPLAKEQIKHGMPSYFYFESVIQFGATKSRILLQPAPSTILVFKDQLQEYEYIQGAIQFVPNDVPYELIRDIIKYRILEIEAKYT